MSPEPNTCVCSRTGALPAKFQRERLAQTTSLLPMVESRPPQSPSLEQRAGRVGLKYRLEFHPSRT